MYLYNVIYRSSTAGKRGVASLRAGIIDNIGKMASQMRGAGGAQAGELLFTGASGPSWEVLHREAVATPTGTSIEENKRYVEIC